MADNVTLNSGSGGDVIATEDITGVEYQKVKLVDGTAASTTAIPLSGDLTNGLDVDVTRVGGTVTVSGTVTADAGTNLNTSALLTTTAYNDSLGVAGTADAQVRTIQGVAGMTAVVTDGSGFTQPVSGTITANAGTGTFTVQEAAAMDVSAATVTVQGVAAEGAAVSGNPFLMAGDDGTNVKHVAVDASGNLQVDIVASASTLTTNDANLQTVFGTSLVAHSEDTPHTTGDPGFMSLAVRNDALTSLVSASGDYSPLSLTSDGALYVATGQDVNDSVADSNLFMNGARATNSVEGLTQVAAADATYVTSDLNGCIVTREHTTLEEAISERDTITTGTSTAFTGAFAAQGAGNHLYVTSISVANTSATDTFIDFQDGASGAVIWTMALPGNGGANMTFPVPLKVAANTALAYQVGAAVTTAYISVCGFVAQG